MKTYLFRFGLFLIGLLTSASLWAQDPGSGSGYEPASLSPDELFVLANVPLLELPDAYKGANAPLLPFFIDNSSQPYFRPITSQSGYECGQSAGVAFNFTYEIDRLRAVPANTTNNQYPTHFVWDFLNSGDNYVGASFFDSWEIVRTCGTMNVTDYGGTLNFGGYKRWISGYDVYYNGMKNRLNSVKAIRVDNPEGLQTLKYWLWDHLEGSSVGGVANFYAKYYSSVTTVLPPGTPEAGKFVQTNWGSSPSHAWTVCGFNDSIRFDYNNDGQYTNNLDITGDGIVDMHDWEIGGLKFASGYAGTGWCNQGFCYLMYKTLADDIGYGGIWNHTVYVVDVKQTCDPKLTMKVTLKHLSRNKLKVTVGMSTDLSAIIPNYIYEYPIFAFQGGPYYMQGGTNESDKTIEFGLDITQILSRLTPGQPAKYFLQVQENDPGNSYPGEIIQMALIDYTSGTPQIINCPSTNVPLLNNDITRITVNHSASFNKPSVTTSALPMATLYQPYSYQLTALGGTTPYLWDVQLDYPEIVTTALFPSVTTQPLTVTNANTGYAVKTLDFPFPFYEDVVNTLYIYVDGYILFDDQPYTYPYLVDPNLLFRQTRILSPFMADLRLYSAQGDGIWYEGDANSATIRWKASINNLPGSTSLNIAVKFYPNGLIEYYYGNMNYPVGTVWTGGMSSGDNRNYQYSQLNNSSAIPANTLNKYTACGYPVEMTLSEEGLFSGTPQFAYANQPVKFKVTDNNGISNTKVLNFTTNGLQIGYFVIAGGDSLIEFGDTALITLSLTNLGSQPVTNINTWITETDPFISLIDSVQYIGTVNPGQTLFIPGAFSFYISPDIPDQHPFSLILHETSAQQNFMTTIDLIALAPDIVIGEIIVADGDNGQLDPGETSPLLITFENHGGAKVQNLVTLLTSGDPLLTINQESGTIPVLKPDSSWQLSFNISASDQAPFEHLYLTQAAMTGNNGYNGSDSIWLFSGEIVEDYETGTFEKFPWYFGGDAPWNIDQVLTYEGVYSIKSGWIFDDMESHVLLTVNVLADGEISFWRRVSCEDDPNGTDFDYLAFFIDNVEQGRWDGMLPWQENSYPVSKGYHTFKWVYHKDNSISGYYDCCWLDFITFPPFEGALPEIEVSPLTFSKALDPGHTTADTLTISNASGGLLEYTLQIFDTTANESNLTDNLTGSSITCSASTFVPGQTFGWNFTVSNTSSDNEYLKNIRMEFPQGVTVNSATNFSGGSLGDLVYDGTTGAGATVNWHGESSGGRGVIKPGETATSVVTGTIGEGNTFDVFIVYVITGDNVGTAPHFVPEEIRISNTGLPNNWLSLSSSTGSLLPGESDEIILNFSAGTLNPGDFTCNLLVRDLWNNIIPIPVTLHINDPIGIPDPVENGTSGLFSYPNPFRDQTLIRYTLQESTQVQLDVSDIRGEPVLTLLNQRQHAGDHLVTWNGTDAQGKKVNPGIYLLRLTTEGETYILKLMFVN
ncbi:MAG: T9SS type A sorting domain-containing protein [bacterium]